MTSGELLKVLTPTTPPNLLYRATSGLNLNLGGIALLADLWDSDALRNQLGRITASVTNVNLGSLTGLRYFWRNDYFVSSATRLSLSILSHLYIFASSRSVGGRTISRPSKDSRLEPSTLSAQTVKTHSDSISQTQSHTSTFPETNMKISRLLGTGTYCLESRPITVGLL